MSKELPWLKVKMPPSNIETLELEHIPEQPGVYLMLSDRTEYTYPWSETKGKSKVYYIGQSDNLRERIGRHKKNLESVISHRDPETIYWSRYEYGIHHGCNVVWVVSQNPDKAEKKALEDFALFYGAKPVANG
jgi:GIY-YIG catalytic domain